MSIFTKLFAKKSLNPALAGEELFAWAKVGMRPEDLAKITSDPHIAESIRSLIYMTKTAIIINFLRREAGDGPADCRPYLVADEFERRVFSSIPSNEQGQAAECIKAIFPLNKKLDEAMRKANTGRSDVEHFGTEISEWSKSWFALIPTWDDPLMLSFLFSGPMSIYVHKQIGLLENSVMSALYEKK